MLKHALIDALFAYKIELSSINKNISSIELKKIDDCQNYINNGNEINGTWLKNNESILLNAIKYACKLKKINGETDDKEYYELNKCIIFYNNLHKE